MGDMRKPVVLCDTGRLGAIVIAPCIGAPGLIGIVEVIPALFFGIPGLPRRGRPVVIEACRQSRSTGMIDGTNYDGVHDRGNFAR